MIPLPTSFLTALGDADVCAANFTGVHVDSRRVVSGDLFVAVGGGVEFLEGAIQRGAAAPLVVVARPDIGIITNIGPVHLELVDSLDGVRRAKSELVDALPAGGTAIVPEDFPVRRNDVTVVRVPPTAGRVERSRTIVGDVS